MQASLRVWICQISFCALLTAQDATSDDRYLRGYAAAVLAREFGLSATELVVEDGALRLPALWLGAREQEQLVKSLRAIPGIRSVTLADATADQPTTTKPSPPLTIYLTAGHLFDPLLADPRWPHFYASYNNYQKGGDNGTASKAIEQVGSAGFGETLAIVRSDEGSLRWEAGLQAGVFAIFDLDSDSKDLVNADYFVGPYAAFRLGWASLLTRIYHQSSHLGDEYILRERISATSRVNLSYEAADLVASLEGPVGFRIYGGASYLLDTDPKGLQRWGTQYGIEWQAPFTIGVASGLRPIFAADLQNRAEYDWDLDYSLRAGVQFEDPGRFSQRMALMFEYYNGRSPNGQFYTERIEFLGLGLHFYF